MYIMKVDGFSGAYIHLAGEKHASFEAFYNRQTSYLPCFYKLKNIDVGSACLSFKLHFQQYIRDYMVMDVQRQPNGKHNYVLCYMLEKDIFIIFDEVDAGVQILFHREKDERLLSIIHLCTNYKRAI